MIKASVSDDYFIGVFSNHGPSDNARFQAAARHAAKLHNDAIDNKAAQIEFLDDILTDLKNGANPVVIALKIDAQIRGQKGDGT